MISSKPTNYFCTRAIKSQTGISLIFFALILVIVSTASFFTYMDSSALKYAREQTTTDVLAEAKAAVIGDTISKQNVVEAGYLRLPDIGQNASSSPTEGNFGANFTGNSANFNVLGKLPWKGYKIRPLKDGYSECLWYVVSGRFKITPASTQPINWDTLGQIDVIDESGNFMASNLVALIISPGASMPNQDRQLSDEVYSECGGNYDARNYLDPFNAEDTIFGNFNYFSGTNKRVAPNSSNTTFVSAKNDFYNDRLIFITTDEIMSPIVRRADFSNAISLLMNDSVFDNPLTPITGNKGTSSVNCSSSTNSTFCNNWKEMLFLTMLPSPSSIEIDGSPTPNECVKVLIFSGNKTSTQSRATDSDKLIPANYLENENLASFAVPIAIDTNFKGTSVFDPMNPTADVIRCIN